MSDYAITSNNVLETSNELTDFVLSELLRGENDASAQERMGTATWLAEKGFADFTIAGEV